MPTLFEHAGRLEALRRLEEHLYASVLGDPVLPPLFGTGHPQHVERLTAFTAESLGGPDRFTRGPGGFLGLIAVHRHQPYQRGTTPTLRGTLRSRA